MIETLLQLLVFEHATGDVTVQVEVGEVTVSSFGGIPFRFCVGNVGYLKNGGGMSVREAIDRAVAEQFGREKSIPRIEKTEEGYAFYTRMNDDCEWLTQTDMDALNELAGKELPVVDASEVKSEWVKVFPPEGMTSAPMTTWDSGYQSLSNKLAKETAFTIWRLTVTR